MKFINCVYTNGIIVSEAKEIKSVEKTIEEEHTESIIVNRIFDLFKDEDEDFFDAEDVEDFYKRSYPMKKIDKKILKKVLKMLNK